MSWIVSNIYSNTQSLLQISGHFCVSYYLNKWLNYCVRLSSDINHLLTFNMQMVYVSQETYTIYMLKLVNSCLILGNVCIFMSKCKEIFMFVVVFDTYNFFFHFYVNCTRIHVNEYYFLKFFMCLCLIF